MASKNQPAPFASPFKFGFFAGLGFFFASALMSVLTFILIALLGLGTIGAMIGGARFTPNNTAKNVQPAMAVSDNQP